MQDNEPQEPMNEELSVERQLQAQQQALTKIYASVEKTRKYIFWSTVMNIVVFVLPLIIVAVSFPFIMSTFTSSLGGGLDESTTSNSPQKPPSFTDDIKSLQDLLKG